MPFSTLSPRTRDKSKWPKTFREDTGGDNLQTLSEVSEIAEQILSCYHFSVFCVPGNDRVRYLLTFLFFRFGWVSIQAKPSPLAVDTMYGIFQMVYYVWSLSL